jgi:hypothetical protein
VAISVFNAGRLFTAAFGVHALACNWAMRLIRLGVARAGSLKAGHQTLDGFSR